MRGEGRYVWDADGTRYLDFFAGILTTISGHAVAEVVDAIREQAGAMLHTSTLYLSAPMIELAERLQQLSGIPDAKVFFTTSGTEANEAALLAATVLPTQQPGARVAEQLPRPIVRHDRDHGEPFVVADEPVGTPGLVRPRRIPTAEPVPRPRRRCVHRRVRARPA